MLYQDMQAAPLWDSVTCQFAGMLTVTDFIDILRHYKAAGKDVSALAVKSIATVLSEPNGNLQTELSFHGADSSCTLQQACQQLLANENNNNNDHNSNNDSSNNDSSNNNNSNSNNRRRRDFLPIVFAEDMRCLACITYTNILEHLVTHFREQRRLFDDSLRDLNIGTYGDALVTAYPSQTLASALEVMHQHSLSALPVLNPSTGQIVGVYSRSDITFLTKATDAEDAVRNLDLPLSEMIRQQRTDVTTPDALRTCSVTHTLQAIFESFAQLRFNRLYIVDDTPQPAAAAAAACSTNTGGNTGGNTGSGNSGNSGGNSVDGGAGSVGTGNSDGTEHHRLIGVVSARDLVAYFLR
jgi:5'-AMP-activated protein kinase regulatory gamma subunit